MENAQRLDILRQLAAFRTNTDYDLVDQVDLFRALAQAGPVAIWKALLIAHTNGKLEGANTAIARINQTIEHAHFVQAFCLTEDQ